MVTKSKSTTGRESNNNGVNYDADSKTSKNEGGTKIDKSKNNDKHDNERIINSEKDKDNEQQTDESIDENSSTEKSRPVEENLIAKRQIDSIDKTTNESTSWTSPQIMARRKYTK